jgi:hypothetical protein
MTLTLTLTPTPTLPLPLPLPLPTTPLTLPLPQSSPLTRPSPGPNQTLVDILVFVAPFALYPKVGGWSIPLAALITYFYCGLLELSKSFFDVFGYVNMTGPPRLGLKWRPAGFASTSSRGCARCGT